MLEQSPSEGLARDAEPSSFRVREAAFPTSGITPPDVEAASRPTPSMFSRPNGSPHPAVESAEN